MPIKGLALPSPQSHLNPIETAVPKPEGAKKLKIKRHEQRKRGREEERERGGERETEREKASKGPE